MTSSGKAKLKINFSHFPILQNDTLKLKTVAATIYIHPGHQSELQLGLENVSKNYEVMLFSKSFPLV